MCSLLYGHFIQCSCYWSTMHSVRPGLLGLCSFEMYAFVTLQYLRFPSRWCCFNLNATNLKNNNSPLQLERCWVICLKSPLSGGRTTSSTRASLSTRISCSPTICRPRPHLEDIRHLRRSSSWLLGSTRCSHISRISDLCYSCGKYAFVCNNLFCFPLRAHRSTAWTREHLCRTPTLT